MWGGGVMIWHACVTGQLGSPWKNRDLGPNAGKFWFFNK